MLRSDGPEQARVDEEKQSRWLVAQVDDLVYNSSLYYVIIFLGQQSVVKGQGCQAYWKNWKCTGKKLFVLELCKHAGKTGNVLEKLEMYWIKIYE